MYSFRSGPVWWCDIVHCRSVGVSAALMGGKFHHLHECTLLIEIYICLLYRLLSLCGFWRNSSPFINVQKQVVLGHNHLHFGLLLSETILGIADSHSRTVSIVCERHVKLKFLTRFNPYQTKPCLFHHMHYCCMSTRFTAVMCSQLPVIVELHLVVSTCIYSGWIR